MSMTMNSGSAVQTPLAHGRHDLIGSDRVEGTNVYRSDGKKIGEIERVMIDKVSGQAAYAVMGFGGFLGMGEDSLPDPVGAADLQREARRLRGQPHRRAAQECAALRHRRGMEVGPGARPRHLRLLRRRAVLADDVAARHIRA